MPQDLYSGQRFQGAVLLPKVAPIVGDLVDGSLWMDTSTDPDQLLLRSSGGNTDVAADGNFAPAEQGYKAWVGDPTGFANNAQAMTSGTMYICRLPVPRSIASVVTIEYWVNTAGATLTTGRNMVGLYNAAGTLLGSVNQDAAGIAAGGIRTATISTVALTGGVGAFVYGAMIWTGTTIPVIPRNVALSAAMANVNIASTAGGYRSASAVIAAGALPNTLPAMTIANVIFWMGLR